MASGSCMPLFASAWVREARPLSVMRTSASSSTASADVWLLSKHSFHSDLNKFQYSKYYIQCSDSMEEEICRLRIFCLR